MRTKLKHFVIMLTTINLENIVMTVQREDFSFSLVSCRIEILKFKSIWSSLIRMNLCTSSIDLNGRINICDLTEWKSNCFATFSALNSLNSNLGKFFNRNVLQHNSIITPN